MPVLAIALVAAVAVFLVWTLVALKVRDWLEKRSQPEVPLLPTAEQILEAQSIGLFPDGYAPLGIPPKR